MEYTKQPITLAEQINILKQRGLIFEDEEQAIAVLNHISFFPIDRLYPQLCCIAYWLNSINPQNTFVQDFRSLLSRYPMVQPSMMGFPRGWENEPLWQ